MLDSTYSRTPAAFRRSFVPMKHHVRLVSMNPLGTDANIAALIEESSSAVFVRLAGITPNSQLDRGTEHSRVAEGALFPDSGRAPQPQWNSEATQAILAQLRSQLAVKSSLADAGGNLPPVKWGKSSPGEYDQHSAFTPKPLVSPSPKIVARQRKPRGARAFGILVTIAVLVSAGGFAAYAVNKDNVEVASANTARVKVEASLAVAAPDTAKTAEVAKVLAASRGEAHVLIADLDGYPPLFAGDVSQAKLDSLESARVALVTASLGEDVPNMRVLTTQLSSAVDDAANDMLTISGAFIPTQTAAEASFIEAAKTQLGLLTAAIAAKGDVVAEMKSMALVLRNLSSNNGAQIAAHEVQRQAGLAAAAVATAMASKTVLSALRSAKTPRSWTTMSATTNSHSATSSHSPQSGKSQHGGSSFVAP